MKMEHKYVEQVTWKEQAFLLGHPKLSRKRVGVDLLVSMNGQIFLMGYQVLGVRVLNHPRDCTKTPWGKKLAFFLGLTHMGRKAFLPRKKCPI
jgi:hypothetical protein